MRLLIVGLDNPQSGDPRHALYPVPRGCTGYRLWQMMQDVQELQVRAYVNIPKTNLFPCGRMEKRLVESAGSLVQSQIRSGKWSAVLLGAVVRDAVMPVLRDYAPGEWCALQKSARVCWIPHPSGRNHAYNDKKFRRKIGKFLWEAYKS